jgi:2-amino-4-hydroxy-6-hydroxymethyldihydropteridine diphosphokinase
MGGSAVTMIVLGLGSNLDDRAQQLHQAVNALKLHLSDMHLSPVYESAALLPVDAPAEWNRHFLNMAVAGQTPLSPRALLEAIKAIERRMGRRPRGHWGPREIDIDILIYGDRIVDDPDLVIPHPGLLLRDFALIPLADVAPEWHYPGTGGAQGKSARELARTFTHSLTQTDTRIL